LTKINTMNIEDLREYCISKKAVSESFPFDQTTLVFKVAGKMYALVDLESDRFINLKCDPEKSIQLRDEYPDAIKPGYHMSKKHWNSVYYHKLNPKLVKELIDHSYELIVASLSKKVKLEFGFSN
jgi:predicted DNA-binding protein (MmcQ/YjbR family)